MGSRLEKNSTEVRKRIAQHTFDNEEGEEYSASKFGGFGDYMRRKKIKLQNLDAELRAHSDKPPIFQNVVAHVNGYTQPSLNDLHVLIVSHGGGFMQYLDGKTAVTHVIASQLTPKKKVEFAKYRVVKPAWIVDSVQAGKLLPWENYRLLDAGVAQKVLAFSDGHMVTQTNKHEESYKSDSNRLWSPAGLTAASPARDQPAAADGEQASLGNQADESASKPVQQAEADGVIDETIAAAQDEAYSEDLEHAGRSPSIDMAEYEDFATPAETVADFSLPAAPPDDSTVENSVTEGLVHPPKRVITAEEHNARLLQNPHLAKSSTANPDFLNQYYRESRLHHLSTWKAELKARLQARALESASQRKPPNHPPGARRYIMHVDFDSFFAAVSLRKNPHLKDKPVVVAHGSGPGSEIASCNYPARTYGIKNGMWMKQALRLCPSLKILPYDYEAYEDASKHFYDSILAMEGIIQSISIDEALIDVSDQCIHAGGSDGRAVSEGSVCREQAKANELARALRASVREKTGCEVSVGVGGNILLAKVALRKAKPAGQYLIKPEDVLSVLGELSVVDLPGVAWSIGNKLEAIGVKLVKDIRELTKEKLIQTLGPKTGEKIWDYSRGIDRQEVGEQAVRKSVSAEINWGIRFTNQQQAEEFIYCLSSELSKRLLELPVKGKHLSLKIMRKAADADLDPPKNLGHGKCDTFNKSVVLGVATADKGVLGKEAVSMLRSYGFPPGELRGLGLHMQKLEPIKPANSNNAGSVDSSQRKLQFKKIDALAATSVPAASAKSRADAHVALPYVQHPSLSLASTSHVRDSERPVEEVPAVGKVKSTSVPDDSPVAPDGRNRHLNIGGTQFVIPSQIDPSVLAELPADIQSKLVPKIPNFFSKRFNEDSGSEPARSRSQSPFVNDSETALPDESQLDAETLAALPEDLRQELLAAYRHGSRTSSKTQLLRPQSPRKAPPLPSRRLKTTPTKKHKAVSLLSKAQARQDRAKGFVQSAFALDRPDKAHGTDTEDEDLISASMIEELPEDVKLELQAEQKRQRIQRAGLEVEIRKRKPRTIELPPDQRQLDWSGYRSKPKPTFSAAKLSTIPDLCESMSEWVQAHSAVSKTGQEGPHAVDVDAFALYLEKVILEERNTFKVQAVVDWLVYLVGDRPFEKESTRRAWERVLARIKSVVQGAMRERGLYPLVFRE